MMTVDMENIDATKWLLDNYVVFEDIFVANDTYYLKFCLKEDAMSFLKLCCRHDVAFTYRPLYGVAIEIANIKKLMEKAAQSGDILQHA